MRRPLRLAPALALAAAALAGTPAPVVLRETPGVGDGAVTRADVDALCDLTVWGFNLLLEDAGEPARLDDDAKPRIAAFFLEQWPRLDGDVQEFAADAARAAPTLRASSAGTDADATVDLFAAFSERIWGGVETATVEYFAGALDAEEYARRWAARGE